MKKSILIVLGVLALLGASACAVPASTTQSVFQAPKPMYSTLVYGSVGGVQRVSTLACVKCH